MFLTHRLLECGKRCEQEYGCEVAVQVWEFRMTFYFSCGEGDSERLLHYYAPVEAGRASSLVSPDSGVTICPRGYLLLSSASLTNSLKMDSRSETAIGADHVAGRLGARRKATG